MVAAIVVGIRPEIIKMAPVIRALTRQRSPPKVVHTGQHYSYQLDRVFFEELSLPAPSKNLEVGSGRQGEQTARILERMEAFLLDEKPSVVAVQGDTNSVLGAALASVKLGIPLAHVEAGLRSYDRRMPEEINRIVADHLSDLLFPPTRQAATQLRGEGIPNSKVKITGNTIVDAVYQNLQLAKQSSRFLHKLGLNDEPFALATAHRQENVDDPRRFRAILKGLEAVGRSLRLRVLFPLHPRSRAQLSRTGFRADLIEFIEPLGYLDFLTAESEAAIILTDSGGVQEEACVLGVPCVTLRDNTERPETVKVGANRLAPAVPREILRAARQATNRRRKWKQPFGDGRAGERIARYLAKVNH